MKRRHRIVAASALVLIAGVLAFVWWLESFPLVGEWAWVPGTSARSPDGMYVATVLEGNGGATTGFLTRVCLYPGTQKLTTDGNGAVNGTESIRALDQGAVFATRGLPPIRLNWESAKRLVISMPSYTVRERGSEPHWQDVASEAWDDVTITYRSYEANP